MMPNLLHTHEETDWTFFATAHVKGAVDGIGATIKITVWKLEKAKNVYVSAALEFYECAQSYLTGITVKYIPKDKVDQVRIFGAKLDECTVAIKHTTKKTFFFSS